MRDKLFLLVVSFLIIAFPVSSPAFDGNSTDYLLKTAPRAAGMGGAFTAVPLDPMGMFWNPSASLRADRFAISGTHSLRHFPGKNKNLDQLDSDMVGVIVPLNGDMVMGAAFNMPGEWGVDYMDTNDVLPAQQRVRGRERRFSLADLGGDASRDSAGYIDSNWYRDDAAANGPQRTFQSGGGFSFYYETTDGMMYGVNVRGLSNLLKGKEATPSERKTGVKITLGAAYRDDHTSDTLAAADLEIAINEDKTRLGWFAGVEQTIDDRLYLRVGSMNGMTTYGAGARAGSLRLDYAVIKNFLPVITNEDDVTLFQDAHFASYTLMM